MPLNNGIGLDMGGLKHRKSSLARDRASLFSRRNGIASRRTSSWSGTKSRGCFEACAGGCVRDSCLPFSEAREEAPHFLLTTVPIGQHAPVGFDCVAGEG